MELSTEARRLADELDYGAGVARAKGLLGFSHYMLSDLLKALELLTEARDMDIDRAAHRAGGAVLRPVLLSVHPAQAVPRRLRDQFRWRS